MPKITTFLAFDDRAEEAAKFYISVFKNSKIVKTTRYGDAAPAPKAASWSWSFSSMGRSSSP